MKCKECCKDISAYDYRKNAGYCKKCYSKNINEDYTYNADKKEETHYKYNNEYNNISKTRNINTIAKFIKVLAIIEGIIGFIVGLISENSLMIGLLYISISVISAMFIYGFGEMIQLLEDIKNK